MAFLAQAPHVLPRPGFSSERRPYRTPGVLQICGSQRPVFLLSVCPQEMQCGTGEARDYLLIFLHKCGKNWRRLNLMVMTTANGWDYETKTSEKNFKFIGSYCLGYSTVSGVPMGGFFGRNEPCAFSIQSLRPLCHTCMYKPHPIWHGPHPLSLINHCTHHHHHHLACHTHLNHQYTACKRLRLSIPHHSACALSLSRMRSHHMVNRYSMVASQCAVETLHDINHMKDIIHPLIPLPTRLPLDQLIWVDLLYVHVFGYTYIHAIYKCWSVCGRRDTL